MLGWEAIASKFNANCTGIKRDLNALKLKIKNLKAQSKKTKLEIGNDPLSENHSVNGTVVENDMNDDDEEYEPDNSDELDTKPIINRNNSNKTRKRCKKFTKDECDLLFKLYEEICVGLDSSSTPNSVKKRNDAWDNLTASFNQQQTSGMLRECNELKIKIKNLKASRVKIEPDTEQRVVRNSHLFNESETSGSKTIIEDRKIITARPIRSLQNIPAQTKNYEEIAHSTAANDIFYDDDDYEEDVSLKFSLF